MLQKGSGVVLILDGNTEHVAHALRKIGLFGEKIRFATALDLIDCRSNKLLLTYTPISKLSYTIS